MKRHIVLGCAAALVAAAGLFTAAPATATPAMGQAEGQVCTVCHDKPGSKLLTDRGKYYETMWTLEGYDEIEGAFGACTSCHVKKPGSKRLTRQGRRVSLVLRDMQELKAWVMARHPELPAEGEEGGPGAEGAAGSEAGGADAASLLLPAHPPLR